MRHILVTMFTLLLLFTGRVFGYTNSNCGSENNLESHHVCCKFDANNKLWWSLIPSQKECKDSLSSHNCTEKTQVGLAEEGTTVYKNMADYCNKKFKGQPPVFVP